MLVSPTAPLELDAHSFQDQCFRVGMSSELPALLFAGELVNLKFIPKSLLLQAEGELWTLPSEELPSSLPEQWNRQGLFKILQDSVYLRVKVEE